MARKGRPTKLTPETAELAHKLAEQGHSLSQIAHIIGVDKATLYRWKNQCDLFANLLEAGWSKRDKMVERSMYELAIGTTKWTDKIVMIDGKPEIIRVEESVVPNVAAQQFILKNRKPEEWQDRSHQDITMDMDTEVKVDVEDLDKAIKAIRKS